MIIRESKSIFARFVASVYAVLMVFLCPKSNMGFAQWREAAGMETKK